MREAGSPIDMTIWEQHCTLPESREGNIILKMEDGSIFPHFPDGAEDIDLHPFKKWGKEYLCYFQEGKIFLIDQEGTFVFPLGVDAIEGVTEMGMKFSVRSESVEEGEKRGDHSKEEEEEVICFEENGKSFFLTKDKDVFAVGEKGKLRQVYSMLLYNNHKRTFLGEECVIERGSDNRFYLRFTASGKLLPPGGATSPYFSTLMILGSGETRKEYIVFERNGKLYNVDKDGRIFTSKGEERDPFHLSRNIRNKQPFVSRVGETCKILGLMALFVIDGGLPHKKIPMMTRMIRGMIDSKI